MERLRPDTNGHARYGHRGWVITRIERDWDARGYYTIGGGIGPKVQWEAHPRNRRVDLHRHYFDRRRDALEFIDQFEDERA